jgi:hypothetical protein
VSIVQIVGYGGVVLVVIFLFGVLTGSGLLTRQQDQRARRQARAQRLINEVRRADEETR